MSGMRSSDWQPMETAPLNPYGKAYGPTVLIWCTATATPLPAYYEPMHGWKCRDTGPAWIVDDGTGDAPIAPEDAAAWMPIAAPWSEAPTPRAIIDDREENGRFSGGSSDTPPVEFLDWFRRNYPGPDTIIHKPDWHAPKVWRAALRCFSDTPAEEG